LAKVGFSIAKETSTDKKPALREKEKGGRETMKPENRLERLRQALLLSCFPATRLRRFDMDVDSGAA
jgi:hypothetical protein